MEAVIFVGIQGAGKSTYFRECFFDTHVRINLDMLRTRAREEKLLSSCLESGQPFVIDNTNPLPADRQRYLQPARAKGFRTVAYSFRPPCVTPRSAIICARERKKCPLPQWPQRLKKWCRPPWRKGSTRSTSLS
jgi:predicted kinase